MNESLEMWVAVPGYEGLYEVSDHGRVMALFSGNHGQFKPGRILKQTPAPNRYLVVGLYVPESVSGKASCRHRTVHSIVLEAFKGPRPKGAVSRHLDGVRTNNTPENLEWGTSKENAQDAKRHGTFVDGERNGYAKLTDSNVLQIRSRRDAGESCQSIANDFNIHWSNVWLIGRRRTWRHVA
jgi:HNH endonuclease/NUMOD4 motif